MRAALALILLGLLAPSQARPDAQLTLYGPAKTSLSSLAVPVGVRAIGMGEAYTSAGNDVYALNWNPSGLASLSDFQLGLTDNEWSSDLGLRQEFLAYGQGLGANAGLAASASYFSIGSLDERSDSGALLGQSSAYALSGELGYGWSLLEDNRLRLGLALEYGVENLFGTSFSSLGGDLGAGYDITRSFSLGISANHLGSGVDGFLPPSSVSVGASGIMLNRRLILDAEAEMPLHSEALLKAGLELSFGALALRGGYRYALGAQDGDVQTGLSAGAGFKLGLFNIDYAFVPYGDLSSTHRVSVTLDLPADFFKPKVIGAESSTSTAKTYYEKGVAMEKNGDLILALVSYQRAKEAYPDQFRAQPQEFYRITLAKIQSVQDEINKSGQSDQVRKMIQTKISEGQALLQAGHDREAASKFKEALALDATSQSAAKLLKEALAGLEGRKSALKSQAREADKAGKLVEAIEDYRNILQIDDTDEDANSFFSDHQAAIKDQLNKIHRKGIELYVSGQVEEAVRIWRLGLSLDPSDPVEFRRDIDKAEKLLHLQEQK